MYNRILRLSTSPSLDQTTQPLISKKDFSIKSYSSKHKQ